MKNYDLKLKSIIENYKLPKISNIFMEASQDSNLELFSSKCTNRRIALWGVGEGSINNGVISSILQKYATYLQKAVCFVDSNPKYWGIKVWDTTIIPPDNIKDWDIEVIVVTSGWRAQKPIKQACKIYAPNCEVIIPNLNMFETAYRESNLYLYANKVRIQYEKCEKRKEKERLLKEIIALFLQIRDFAFAFRYIDSYISENYIDRENMTKLRADVLALLSEMSKKIKNRKRDMIFLFPDRISREEYQRIDMFSYLKENVYSFKDANSTALYTFESMTSTLKEKMPLEVDIYTKELAHKTEEVPILKEALEQGYKIHVESIKGYPMFQGEDVTIFYSSFLSEKLWNVLCNMCENTGCILEYIYCYESHYPELCAYHPNKTYEEIEGILADTFKYYRTNYHDCLRYIDMVFEFYYHLFPVNMILIIHSDHSFKPTDVIEVKEHDKVLLNKKYCVEVPLLIQGAGIVGEYKKMFSLIDFTQIILQIMRHKKLKIPDREIINYQMHPIHGVAWKQELIAQGKGKYTNQIDVYTSKEFVYLLIANKWGEVYRVDNINNEITDTEEGWGFIQKVNKFRKEEDR